MIETRLYLNAPYRGIKNHPLHIITAPNGDRMSYRMNISEGSELRSFLVESCGCDIKDTEEQRKGVSDRIGGVRVEFEDSRKTVIYHPKDKPEACDLYNRVLKPAIQEDGCIVEGHDCRPYIPQKPRPCLEGTILGYVNKGDTKAHVGHENTERPKRIHGSKRRYR